MYQWNFYMWLCLNPQHPFMCINLNASQKWISLQMPVLYNQSCLFILFVFTMLTLSLMLLSLLPTPQLFSSKFWIIFSSRPTSLSNNNHNILDLNVSLELSKADSFYKWENWVPEKRSDLPTSWSWNQDYVIPTLVHILPLYTISELSVMSLYPSTLRNIWKLDMESETKCKLYC